MLRDRFSPAVAALLSGDDWLIPQEEYNSGNNLDWESRFCLASGFMSSRGSEICGTSRPSLPATYAHGVFDRSEAFMRELVNLPDWAKLKVYVNCVPVGVDGKISDYLRVLDLNSGLLAARYTAHLGEDGRGDRHPFLPLCRKRRVGTRHAGAVHLAAILFGFGLHGVAGGGRFGKHGFGGGALCGLGSAVDRLEGNPDPWRLHRGFVRSHD